MSGKTDVAGCLIAFALAFALRQAAVFFFTTEPYASGIGSLVSIGIISISIVFIKAKGLDFREHGFHLPKKANRLLATSLFLAVLYVIIVIFLPGAASGFEAFPSAPISLDLLFAAGSFLLAAIAAETILRGYVQTSLDNAYGFPAALIVVSVMFTLYMLSIRVYSTADSTELIRLSLPTFAESTFLCFFFKETKTLLCPIVFAATVTILQTFTPLQPTATDYATVVSILCYIALTLIMHVLISEFREQKARLNAAPVFEPEQPLGADGHAF
jgi:membrane protease YdiL (CAAX protease family)